MIVHQSRYLINHTPRVSNETSDDRLYFSEYEMKLFFPSWNDFFFKSIYVSLHKYTYYYYYNYIFKYVSIPYPFCCFENPERRIFFLYLKSRK